MGSYTPTKFLYAKGQYYGNIGDTNSKLDFNHLYGTKDKSDLGPEKYFYNIFLFYPEGIVVNYAYHSASLSDTFTTFTYNFLTSKCHGWTMGCYNISNDTIRFETIVGYQNFWCQYEGLLEDNSITIYKKSINNKEIAEPFSLSRFQNIVVEKRIEHPRRRK